MLQLQAAQGGLHRICTPEAVEHGGIHVRPGCMPRRGAASAYLVQSNTNSRLHVRNQPKAALPRTRPKLQAVQHRLEVEVEFPSSSNYIYTIPVRQEPTIQRIEQAQAAAEAEQAKLMTAGPLADEISKGNKLLQDIMSSYNTLQRLYHKACLAVVERHSPLATSNVDLAYSIYCELLSKKPSKRPGDSISSAELEQLSQQVNSSAGHVQDQHMAQFAHYLVLWSEPKAIRDICVMPEATKLLMAGFTNADSAITGFSKGLADTFLAEGHFARGMFENITSATVGGALQYFLKETEPKLIQLMIAMCQPGSSPPDPALAFPGLQLMVATRLVARTACMSSYIYI